MQSFTQKEILFLKKLNTPAKVQDYLNSLKFNFEIDAKGKTRDTIKSPIRSIREGNAHCFEGAILGAYILSLHGHKPLILYLQATKQDFDHVIALFRENGLWGALSKTNHAVLRYREPVYQSIRELVMSYFHEYFTKDGKKNLRKYSKPLDLNIFKSKGWASSEEDLWYIDEKLDSLEHYDLVPKRYFKKLRPADDIETQAGEIVEFIAPNKKTKK
jgi:hypothetical protein